MKLPSALLLLGLLSLLPVSASAQSALSALPLENPLGFQPTTSNWQIVGGVATDPTIRHDIRTTPGYGILVNAPSEGRTNNVSFGWEHGDLQLEFEFMMPKESNSGIYLQGRYEIQLLDSWGTRRPSFSDVGGIYQRWNPDRPQGQQGYQGHAPRMNVARAPGLWQKLQIQFQAPRFDEQGHKTANARMVEVKLNGVVIHQNVELTGPTRGSIFPDERPMGSLMLQGDHGPIAIRNIRYALELPEGDAEATPPRVGSILVEPDGEPAVIRGFMNHAGKKKTHTIAVGHSEGVHYSMDLRQGSLMHMWKGDFLETTDMWHSRGQHQLATPTGSVISLDGRPTVARLSSEDSAWPDSMGLTYRFDGYELDDAGHPAFSYRLGGVAVSDRVLPESGGKRLVREITLKGEADGYWVRMASGGSIQILDDGHFGMNDGSHYLTLHGTAHSEAVIRSIDGVSELLIPASLADGQATVRYTLTW
jgi:hypothetical protein